MSEIKRYYPGYPNRMFPSDEGDYVFASTYDTFVSEIRSILGNVPADMDTIEAVRLLKGDADLLRVEIADLKQQVGFFKAFADPPDMKTGKTVRDELRQQVVDAEDKALEKAAHVAEKSKRNGRLFIASEIRALKSNQK